VRPRKVRIGAHALVFVIILLAGPGGCSRDNAYDVEMPATPVITSRDSWAVVRGAYVRILQEPQVQASIQGHVRRGAILQIENRTAHLETVDGQQDRWLEVHGEDVSGWIFGAYVDSYATRELAETAARALRGE